MINKSVMISGIATLVLCLGWTSGRAVAQIPHQTSPPAPAKQAGEFRRIAQPLWVKGAVTISGLGLMGLELWWFLLSKSKSSKATMQTGVQEITVIVAGGYEPSQIVVQVGHLVRLNFDRQDPNSCLEEVRFPDFHIAQALPLNQITAIEFTPDHPGRYEFTCGMNMFRGVVDVRSAEPAATGVSATSPSHTYV